MLIFFLSQRGSLAPLAIQRGIVFCPLLLNSLMSRCHVGPFAGQHLADAAVTCPPGALLWHHRVMIFLLDDRYLIYQPPKFPNQIMHLVETEDELFACLTQEVLGEKMHLLQYGIFWYSLKNTCKPDIDIVLFSRECAKWLRGHRFSHEPGSLETQLPPHATQHTAVQVGKK